MTKIYKKNIQVLKCKTCGNKIATSSSLQQVIVHGETFYYILLQYLSRPYSELNTSIGMNTITYADNHVEVVESHLVLLNFSFNSTMFNGCCKKCNNLFFVKFPIFQNILYMS